jgi:hypothetical protein
MIDDVLEEVYCEMVCCDSLLIYRAQHIAPALLLQLDSSMSQSVSFLPRALSGSRLVQSLSLAALLPTQNTIWSTP